MEEINQLSQKISKKLSYCGTNTKRIKTMKTTKFNIADYLKDNEMIAEYLNTVFEEGDSSDIIVAIGHIAKAIGMYKIGFAQKVKFSSS